MSIKSSHSQHPSRFGSAAFKRVVPVLSLTLALALGACGGGQGGASHARSGHVLHDDPLALNDEPLATGNTDKWSQAATWGGKVPGPGDEVVVPAGRTIIMDTDIEVASIMVNGNLVCGQEDITVDVNWVMVHGLLQCGTAKSPHNHQFSLTLHGGKTSPSVMGMGSKVLGAMGGGRINLHGQERTSWLMLADTANQGDQDILVEYNTNWRAGDLIVITSTDDEMMHAELRRINSIDGRRLKLDRPLDHRHFGQVQSFGNGTRSWEVDTRAEVGLLSHNIRIQGDEQSEALRFGGHMMIMASSAATLSGVEFYRMGQEGILGRYPFHWHLANDVTGQYIRNSSIRRSYNRCVVVHGTHNARVEDNVCYDHVGHGFFLEDGVETGNLFKHNLGLVTRRPAANVALHPSDLLEGEAARGPATFWISNPTNTFIGNAAAGSDGLGFWYDTKDNAEGASASLKRYAGVVPRRAAFGEFRENRVHSSDMAFSTCTEGSGPAGYLPPERAVFHKLTVFAGGDGAVWPCEGNQLFTEMKITDTGHTHHAGFVAPRPVTVKDSLFVANSELSAGGRGRQRSAIGIYDFGVDLRRVHFANFNGAYGGSYMFGARDADVRFTSNPISEVTLADSYLYYDTRKQPLEMRPSAWGAVIHDEDGSLGLGPNTALVADHPMMVDNTCTDLYGSGRLCSRRYGRVELDFNGLTALPPLTHLRSDGPQVTIAPLPERAHYQSVVSVNHGNYHYRYRFDQAVFAAGKLDVHLDFLHDGDTVVLELVNLPVAAHVTTADYSAAASIDELKQGAGKQYFRLGGALFVKLRATGDRWHATDSVGIAW